MRPDSLRPSIVAGVRRAGLVSGCKAMWLGRRRAGQLYERLNEVDSGGRAWEWPEVRRQGRSETHPSWTPKTHISMTSSIRWPRL